MRLVFAHDFNTGRKYCVLALASGWFFGTGDQLKEKVNPEMMFRVASLDKPIDVNEECTMTFAQLVDRVCISEDFYIAHMKSLERSIEFNHDKAYADFSESLKSLQEKSTQ